MDFTFSRCHGEARGERHVNAPGLAFLYSEAGPVAEARLSEQLVACHGQLHIYTTNSTLCPNTVASTGCVIS